MFVYIGIISQKNNDIRKILKSIESISKNFGHVYPKFSTILLTMPFKTIYGSKNTKIINSSQKPKKNTSGIEKNIYGKNIKIIRMIIIPISITTKSLTVQLVPKASTNS